MWGGELHHGDCLDVLRTLPDNSVHAVVTDPPYNLSFMAKQWDTHASAKAFQDWCELWATECLRVLRPGGYMLSFGGTRTWHRLAAAVEDAGFEIRDSIAWLYGSGFPKSLDVSKAIDKAAGATRETVGRYSLPSGQAWNLSNDEATPGDGGTMGKFGPRSASLDITAPATDAARQWAGWGTALKPAFEPIVVARKPLTGTVAANVQAWGTGALNIDGCRVHGADVPEGRTRHGGGLRSEHIRQLDPDARNTQPAGRWPANVALDGDMADALDAQSGPLHTQDPKTRGGGNLSRPAGMFGEADPYVGYHDPKGSGASRFFPTFRYQAKAPTRERPKVDGVAHNTVKPLELMRWLVRLVTPPGGVVLEPFAGSGTTVEACILEGFDCIAIEREAEYLPLIRARVERAMAAWPTVPPVSQLELFGDDGDAA